MKQITKVFFYSSLFFLVTACQKDIEPGPGFSESFYVKLDFQNEQIRIEENEPDVFQFWAPGPRYGWSQNYGSGNGKYDVGLKLEFDKNPIDKTDIENLEGKKISTDEDSFPSMRLFISSNENTLSYATGLTNVDYGTSNFFISEVIKGPKIDVGDERRRSYILRGEFDLNISKSSWTLGIPDTLYPINNGEFSMQVYLP